ncbi:hypothetical protein EVAR_61305_1 [Eumeta japonica]|uniref:Uncharacterized protein n=1 Tax=Eumeta variegata TaxID=151549 RepID=A0A4C1XMW9_EUMVA|nr:hypothetical protein EVAR_61305_1 [Eumeta japonica]
MITQYACPGHHVKSSAQDVVTITTTEAIRGPRPAPGQRGGLGLTKQFTRRLCAAAVSLLLERFSRWSGKEIARSALSLARSALAKRDNESCFFPARAESPSSRAHVSDVCLEGDGGSILTKIPCSIFLVLVYAECGYDSQGRIELEGPGWFYGFKDSPEAFDKGVVGAAQVGPGRQTPPRLYDQSDTDDPGGKVDEKATQLHAIASLKVLLEATRPAAGKAGATAARHSAATAAPSKDVPPDLPNGGIAEVPLDAIEEVTTSGGV